MKFVDEVSISAVAGKGGDGAISWRREKYLPRGGPDGGDGGDGGSVIFRSVSSVNTLIDYAFRPLLKAGIGENGGANNRHGKNGKDLECRVPVGTQIFFRGELVADLGEVDALWVACRGGHGGKGNTYYKSSTNQTPDYAQRGQEAEEFEFTLSLKSVADVGLIGLPNAGKSTLISSISAAKPKIADYPFTTITPNLGVVSLGREQSFVVADIPGIIEKAYLGKGLGIKFLKHVERTSHLCFMLDAGQRVSADGKGEPRGGGECDDLLTSLKEQYQLLSNEVLNFSLELATRPRVIVISKVDLFPEIHEEEWKELGREENFAESLSLSPALVSSKPAFIVHISSLEKTNTNSLIRKLYNLVQT